MESFLGDIGMGGELWSSSLSGGYDDVANYLYFYYDGNVVEFGYYRCYGRSVRGVQA
jgi:hypothetical protein